MDKLPQGLASLPNELILIIFELISKITDKRQFLKTCNKYNIITKQLIKYYEDNFIVEGFDKINSYRPNKFALELCHDKYFDMIPEIEITSGNMFLVKALAFFGDTIILDRLININKLHMQSRSNDHSSQHIKYRLRVFDDLLSKYAILNNQIGVLILIKNNYNLSKNACIMAIEKGNLEILKWLKENGCVFDCLTQSQAVHYGNLPCIKYVYEHSIAWEWNMRTCNEVTNNGNMEILKWARENGCPI